MADTKQNSLAEYILFKSKGMDSTRADFILQILSDQMAFSEGMPIRILDLDQLDNTHQLLLKISKEEGFKTLHRRENPNEELDDEVCKLLGGKGEFDQYLSEFVNISTEIFANVNNKFNDAKTKIHNEMSNHNELLDHYEYATKLDQLMDEHLGDSVELECHLPEGLNEKLTNLKDQNKFKLIRKLLLEIEHRVWRTDHSYTVPINALFRMSNLWSLLHFSWLYVKRNEIKWPERDEILSIHQALGIDGMVFYLFNLQPENCKLVCVCGPFFSDQSNEDTPKDCSYEDCFHDCENGLLLKYCFLKYQRLVSHDVADKPHSEEIISTFTNQITMPRKLRNQHLENLRISWELLLNIEVDREAVTLKLSRCDIEFIATSVCFLTRTKKGLQELREQYGSFALNVFRKKQDRFRLIAVFSQNDEKEENSIIYLNVFVKNHEKKECVSIIDFRNGFELALSSANSIVDDKGNKEKKLQLIKIDDKFIACLSGCLPIILQGEPTYRCRALRK